MFPLKLPAGFTLIFKAKITVSGISTFLLYVLFIHKQVIKSKPKIRFNN